MADIVNDFIHALFSNSLKGKFLVEVKASVVVDADNIKDAEAKGLAIIKNDTSKLKPWAMRLFEEGKVENNEH